MGLKISDPEVVKAFQVHPEVHCGDLVYVYVFQDEAVGLFAAVFTKYYYLAWDGNRFYLMQITLGGKEKSFLQIGPGEIESVKIKDRLLDVKIGLILKDRSIYQLKCVKKVRGLHHQARFLERIRTAFGTLFPAGD